MRIVALSSLVVALLAGCGEPAARLAGQTCVGTSECAAGLVCDFGQDPPVCASQGSGTPTIDAAPGAIDAAGIVADAEPGAPDAPPAPIDAAVPDAAVPDAAVPDAAPI